MCNGKRPILGKYGLTDCCKYIFNDTFICMTYEYPNSRIRATHISQQPEEDEHDPAKKECPMELACNIQNDGPYDDREQ